jgi:hypothetical protein
VSGLVGGPGFGLMIGLAVGLVAAGRAGSETPWVNASTRLSLSLTGLSLGGVVGLVSGLVTGLVRGPSLGLGFGFALGVATALSLGLRGVKSDLTFVAGPATLLSSDRRAFITMGLVSSLTGGIAFATIGALVLTFVHGVTVLGALVGAAFGSILGCLFGLGLGLAQAAWPYFAVARAYLAMRRKTPWKLMAFLRDAHERGVLRRVGPVYQFRHIDLQRHLAQQDL